MISTFRRAPLRIHHPGASPILVDLVSRMDQLVFAAAPIGSRITCDPAPQDTDEDWLLLIAAPAKDDASALVNENAHDVLRAAGFTQDGQPDFYTGKDEGEFRSWRLGELNVVTTPSGEFYERFMTATHLAKRFNLLDKSDRIALFQVILYGVSVENLKERERSTVIDLLLGASMP